MTPTTNMQTTRPPEEEAKLRKQWENRVTGALFRQLKRKVLQAAGVANAVFGTPEWESVRVDQSAMWFMPRIKRDLTRHPALAEECLDDARAHAKRKGWTPIPQEFLPRWIKSALFIIASRDG